MRVQSTAKAAGKFCAFTIAHLSIASIALANPVGGTVVGGSASITNTSPSELDINQSSNKAVIDWNSFNIANGETTKFIQPGATSIALNRVTNSSQISTINGNLFANGQVLILNPNGVLIGKNGNINTAGFVATTAGIDNNSFMNSTGALNFNQAGNANATVENDGNITVGQAGLAALVAPTVRNNGVIQGNLAKVQLGAADTFAVDLYGDGLFNLAVNAPQDNNARTITSENNGTITATGGQVIMTAAAASNLVNSVVNNTGNIQAKSIGNYYGEIILSGAGANVNDSGNIDVSGANGGGIVKIGGGAHGTDASVANAANTTVTGNINANATGKGNGGNVTVWSNGKTNFSGNITATGGQNGGNGGFVETSGHNINANGGNINLSAAHGNTGTWLIDPATLDICYSTTTCTQTVSGASMFYFDGTSGTQLNTNANISLIATGSLDLDFNSHALTMGNGFNVSLSGANINVLSASTITTSGAGGVTLTGPISLSAPLIVNSGTGGISFISTIDSNDALTAQVLTVNSTGAVSFGGSLGDINPLGDVTVAGTAISFSGDITANGNVTVTASDSVTQNSTSTITTASGVYGNGTNGDGNVTIAAGSGGINIGNISTNVNNFNVYAAGGNATFTTTNSGNITTGNISLMSDETGNLALNATSAGSLNINGDINIYGSNNDSNSLTSAGTAILTAAKDVNITGAVNVSGYDGNEGDNLGSLATLDINSIGGNITVGGDINVSSEAQRVDNGGNDPLNATATLNITALSTAPSAGNITLGGNVVASASLEPPAGGVTTSIANLLVQGDKNVNITGIVASQAYSHNTATATTSIFSDNGNVNLTANNPGAFANDTSAEQFFDGTPINLSDITNGEGYYSTSQLMVAANPGGNTANGFIIPNFKIDPLGRPVISVGDQAINLYLPFRAYDTFGFNTDVSIREITPPSGLAASFAGIAPAAGGNEFANIEPAAGGNNTAAAASNNAEISCANNFLDNKPCTVALAQ